MIKKICIVIVILLILAGAAVAYIVYNANSLIARYKSIVEQKVSQVAGTPVKLGEIQTGLFPNFHLNIDKCSIGADGSSQGVTLNNLTLDVNLRALLNKRLEISKLSISGPKVKFVRQAGGVVIEGLPKQKSPPISKSNAPSQGAADAPLPISLNLFEVKDAEITFDDQLSKKTYQIKPLNVSLEVALQGSLVTLDNLNVQGKTFDVIPFSLRSPHLTFDQATAKATIPQMTVGLFSSQHTFAGEIDTRALAGSFSLENTKPLVIAELLNAVKILPPDQANTINQFALEGNLEPRIKGKFELPQTIAALGTIALSKLGAKVANFAVQQLEGTLNLDANLQQLQLHSQKLALNLNGQAMEVVFKAGLSHFKIFELSEAHIKAFAGTISANARAELVPNLPYNAVLQAINLQIGQAMAVISPSTAKLIEGNLNSLNVKINGAVTDKPILALQADGNAMLGKSRLIGVNLVSEVLRAIDNLPFLSKGNLYASIPPEDRAAFDSPDTNIDSLSSDFSLRQGVMQIRTLTMYTPFFVLDASGSASLGLDLNLNATIIFAKAITDMIVRSNKGAAKILDAQGRFVVPLTIKGTLPKVLLYPNLSKLAEIAAEKAVQAGAQKLLERALRGKGGGDEKVKGLRGILGF